MSTLNPTRKISRRHELREDKVVTFYARVLDIVDKHRNAVIAAGAVIVIIVAAVIGWNMLMAQQNETAVTRMAAAVRTWEAGEYQTALDGTDSFLGLHDIIDDFGSTDAGNLARYYAADAHFNLGAFDEAMDLFEAFDKTGNHLGAAALAGEAAILEVRGEPGDAASRYLRAANIFVSDVTSPIYLMKAGRAFEAAGDTRAAARLYEQVRDDYPDSQEARDIAFHLARVGSDA